MHVVVGHARAELATVACDAEAAQACRCAAGKCAKALGRHIAMLTRIFVACTCCTKFFGAGCRAKKQTCKHLLCGYMQDMQKRLGVRVVSALHESQEEG